jgi:hypothetical protein
VAGSIAALIPEFQPYARDLVTAAGSAGLQPRVTSTLRTRAEQTRLYRRYLEGLSQFPAAPPGRSAHEYGYALDIVCSPLEANYDLGAFWQEAGGVWSPKDIVHFEYPGFNASDFDRGSGTNPLEQSAFGATVRTVADWFNSLPWYVQILLPAWTATSDEKITEKKIKQLLGR